MNGPGYGEIRQVNLQIGIAIITVDETSKHSDITDDELVYFSSSVLVGGMFKFANLKNGDRVGFSRYKTMLNDNTIRFAEAVWTLEE